MPPIGYLWVALVVLDRCNGGSSKGPALLHRLPYRYDAKPAGWPGSLAALDLKKAGHLHVDAPRLHGKLSEGELRRLDALPVGQPAYAVQHLPLGIYTYKRGREMALNVAPVFIVDGPPHQ